jgi:hypothetical protein
MLDLDGRGGTDDVPSSATRSFTIVRNSDTADSRWVSDVRPGAQPEGIRKFLGGSALVQTYALGQSVVPRRSVAWCSDPEYEEDVLVEAVDQARQGQLEAGRSMGKK